MNESGRVMGLDVGSVRVGVALSDPLRITAQPHSKLPAQPWDQLIESLLQLVEQEEVAQVVVGLPKRLDGSQGDSADQAKALGKELRAVLSIPVRFWDERYSTHAAERSLLEGNMRRNKRKQVIDQTAAAWMLQGYLDSRSS